VPLVTVQDSFSLSPSTGLRRSFSANLEECGNELAGAMRSLRREARRNTYAPRSSPPQTRVSDRSSMAECLLRSTPRQCGESSTPIADLRRNRRAVSVV
jgi:hypothetical protein